MTIRKKGWRKPSKCFNRYLSYWQWLIAIWKLTKWIIFYCTITTHCMSVALLQNPGFTVSKKITMISRHTCFNPWLRDPSLLSSLKCKSYRKRRIRYSESMRLSSREDKWCEERWQVKRRQRVQRAAILRLMSVIDLIRRVEESEVKESSGEKK